MPHTTHHSAPAGRCWRDGCTNQATVVIEDHDGGQANVCPDCHRDAQRTSGGSTHGIGTVSRRP